MLYSVLLLSYIVLYSIYIERYFFLTLFHFIKYLLLRTQKRLEPLVQL